MNCDFLKLTDALVSRKRMNVCNKHTIKMVPLKSFELRVICYSPWWLLHESATWHHLYCVFRYIHPLKIDKNPHERQNISIFYVLFYVSFSWRPLHFLVKALHFYSYFSCFKVNIINKTWILAYCGKYPEETRLHNIPYKSKVYPF